MTIYLVSSCVKQSGKTTLATNLTDSLSRQGRTLLLDIDAKKCAYDWAQQTSRQFDYEHHLFDPNDAEFFKTRLAQLKQHYADIVIDADGSDSKAFRSIMFVADKMLIPLSTDLKDYENLTELLQLAIAIKQFNPDLQIYVIFNKVTAALQQDELERSKQLLQDLPTVRFLNSIIYEDQALQTALSDGQSIWQNHTESAAVFDRLVLELQDPVSV